MKSEDKIKARVRDLKAQMDRTNATETCYYYGLESRLAELMWVLEGADRKSVV